MSIFNKTVSAGNLFNGAIDQYSRRIAIGSQHFQRTLPTFFSFLSQKFLVKTAIRSSPPIVPPLMYTPLPPNKGIGLSITTELTIIPFARSLN